MTRGRTQRLFVAIAFILLPVAAQATQCSVTTTPLSFGNYDPFSSVPLSTSSSISITCQTPDKKPQIVTLMLSAGSSGSPSQRMLVNPSGTGSLLYNIFTSPSGGQILGDGTASSASLNREVSRSTPWQVSLYGVILPLQNVPPGAYSDSLTATILW